MLDLLLGHWMTYMYLTYVVVLIVCFLGYRQRTPPVSWRPRVRNIR
jgi:hypothetical protein